MRFKLVPAAPDALDVVADAQRAVPLVPDSEDDCCARLMRRLDFPSRDVARTWLTFLRALDLAEETPSGFRRRRIDPDEDHIWTAFRTRVFGAEELLDVLESATDPLSAADAFERVRERVPTWEHYKDPGGWEQTWRERVEHILDWFVLFGVAERRDRGYASVSGTPTEK
ncbi:MAG: hypothetical protein ACQETI_13970 [Halobacteriota archaeon]